MASVESNPLALGSGFSAGPGSGGWEQVSGKRQVSAG